MSDQTAGNLWHVLEVIARRRGLIIGLTLAATAVAVVISLLLPPWYSSTALLMPPPDQPRVSGISGLADVGILAGGTRVPGMITQNDVYARMLRSRRISDRIIDIHRLDTLYKASNRTGLYEALAAHVSIRVIDEGMLSIAVEARQPEMAAAIARTYVDELTKLNSEILTPAVRQKREFIEARRAEFGQQLTEARGALERFQIDKRAVNFDQQTRLAIDQAVSLKVQEAALNLEIAMDRQQLGDDNPILHEKRQRLAVIQKELHKLEWGGPDSSFFSLPMAAVPALRGEYGALYARVTVAESLHGALLELLEEARIQEKEQGPVIAVLDWPEVPDMRSRPQRSLIVLGAFACALILAIALALLLEFVRRLESARPDDHRRLLVFAHAFLGWLPGVKRKAVGR
jgi:uncharacterized protein involved in exopolysaccharide biosynthesis